EVLESVFDRQSSDVKDSLVNDRFAKVEGMHAVPPPMKGIYMPPVSDFRIDELKFTYGPKQSKTSESDAKTSDLASCESNYSVETLESVPKPVESKSKAVSEPKVCKGQITGKDNIRTGKLDFKDVYFVKELQHFNLFFVSQICDKKNKVLFTDTECLVLSPDFKFPDKNQVLLRVPRQNNMYSFNLENIVPSRKSRIPINWKIPK
nr:putative ribonuclease H-like domain-containing protein [Tanacetum cinerariifolium]